MSSNALHRLTEKKGKQLSKFLGIDSVPSTQLIATMQSRINNPIFTLSMTDYEAMCGNKMMVKMMSKALKCDVRQLEKFCKFINYFKDNMPSDTSRYNNKKIEQQRVATNKSNHLSKLLRVDQRNTGISINATMQRESLHNLPDDILKIIVQKYRTLLS